MKRVFELKVKFSDNYLQKEHDEAWIKENIDSNGYYLAHYSGNKSTKLENVSKSYRSIKERFYGKGTIVDIKDVKEI